MAYAIRTKPSPFNDVMLDLETLGSVPGSAIVMIGAIEFDRNTGKIGKSFYQKIQLSSCVDAGLIIDPNTVLWWLGQNDEARKAMASRTGEGGLKETLLAFTFWFLSVPDRKIWGNGGGFDQPMLKVAYDKFGLPVPWKYNAERDVRTLVDIMPGVMEKTKRVGALHDPIADCVHQIKYVCGILAKIKKKK